MHSWVSCDGRDYQVRSARNAAGSHPGRSAGHNGPGQWCHVLLENGWYAQVWIQTVTFIFQYECFATVADEHPRPCWTLHTSHVGTPIAVGLTHAANKQDILSGSTGEILDVSQGWHFTCAVPCSSATQKGLIMSYRKILVPIIGAEDDKVALVAAFRLARQFGAHTQALFVRLDPVRAVPYGYMGTDVSGFSAQYAIEAAIRAADEAQAIASTAFDNAVKNFKVEVNPTPGARNDATTHLKIVQGDFVEEIERHSRLCDLIVFGFGDVDRSELVRGGLEAALLSGTRPVLFVPKVSEEPPGRRIAVAYDGSATAAHAVTAALPFLSRAKAVHTFEITTETGASAPLKELREYLALRGIETIEHLIDPGLKSTAEALSLAIQGHQCDLLVMGGYGHSRLREFVLGGVTRHVLKHTTPFSVLMVH